MDRRSDIDVDRRDQRQHALRAAAAACLALLLLLAALAMVGLDRLSALTENLDEARVRQRVVQDQVNAVATQVAPPPGQADPPTTTWRAQVHAELRDLGTSLLDVTVRVDKVGRALEATQGTVDELRALVRELGLRPKVPDDGR